jgi:hypothetical protein
MRKTTGVLKSDQFPNHRLEWEKESTFDEKDFSRVSGWPLPELEGVILAAITYFLKLVSPIDEVTEVGLSLKTAAGTVSMSLKPKPRRRVLLWRMRCEELARSAGRKVEMKSTLVDRPTSRGFSRYEFADGNGVMCSLQQSSAAERAMIWLGCNKIGLKRFSPGKGWEDIETPDEGPDGIGHVANTRMHLTQEQVAALLPILQRFVDTGEIERPGVGRLPK